MKITLEPEYKIVNGVVTNINKLSEFAERLLSRRDIQPNGCWNYVGAKTTTGQGQLNRNGQRMVANRASYETFIGSIPHGLAVGMTCKNNSCFNPEHLYLKELSNLIGKS